MILLLLFDIGMLMQEAAHHTLSGDLNPRVHRCRRAATIWPEPIKEASITILHTLDVLYDAPQSCPNLNWRICMQDLLQGTASCCAVTAHSTL